MSRLAWRDRSRRLHANLWWISVDRPVASGQNHRLFRPGLDFAGSGLAASTHSGGIPKRPTGADCKSAGLRLRWFESTSLHQFDPFADHVLTRKFGGTAEVDETRRWFDKIAGSDFERAAGAARRAKGRMPGVIHLPPPVRSVLGLRVDKNDQNNKVAFPRGSSSTVEPQPSKLMVRVRSPSPAPLSEL